MGLDLWNGLDPAKKETARRILSDPELTLVQVGTRLIRLADIGDKLSDKSLQNMAGALTYHILRNEEARELGKIRIAKARERHSNV